MGVASTFRVSGPELEHYLKGKNPLCDYLVQVTQTQALQDGGKCHMEQTDLGCYSVCLAYGGKALRRIHLAASPVPEYDHRMPLIQPDAFE